MKHDCCDYIAKEAWKFLWKLRDKFANVYLVKKLINSMSQWIPSNKKNTFYLFLTKNLLKVIKFLKVYIL